MKPLEMTQAAAAKTLGMSTVRLNELVRGKRGVTADTVLRFAQLFKTTPQFWMHMQANFDLKAAMVRRRTMLATSALWILQVTEPTRSCLVRIPPSPPPTGPNRITQSEYPEPHRDAR